MATEGAAAGKELPDRRAWQRAKQALIGSGLLAIASVAGWLISVRVLEGRLPPLTIAALTVTRGDVEVTVNETGIVDLGDQTTLTAPREATVDRVLVQVREAVTQGQPLLTLRSPADVVKLETQQLAIRQQELAVLMAQQTLAEKTLERTRNREQIEEAQAELVAARQKLQETTDLVEQGFVPAEEIQQHQAEVRKAEATLRQAQTDARKAEVAIASQHAEVHKQQAELAMQKLKIREITQELQANIVVAPITGKVLQIQVRNGDGVSVGKALLTLGNPALELIRLNLSTLNASKVALNQTARITVIGTKGKSFQGKVVWIDPLATTPDAQSTNPFSGGEAGPTVPAIIQLDRPTGTLIPGSQVSVEIILDRRQQVLHLPSEALQQDQDQTFVWIVDPDGRAQRRPVTKGLEGIIQVEIVQGLQAGDRVLLPTPDQALTPNQPVTPEMRQEL
ncbi:efflux RND transporter periplasmic adaptor subunit [Trichothermofontia sp.]